MKTDQMAPYPRINLPVGDVSGLGKMLIRVSHPDQLNELAQDWLGVFSMQSEQAMKRLTLEENEALALLDLVNGLYIEPRSAHYLLPQLQDGLQDGLAEKWDIDAGSLLWRIEALHPFEVAALAMTLKSIWNVQEQYKGGLLEAARALGLLPATTPLAP